MEEKPDWVSIGFVARPHGIRGELKVIGVDDEVVRFREVTAVRLEPMRGEAVEFAVERFRATGREILLKLAGIEDRTQAEQWRSAAVYVRRDETPPLGEDAYYAFELVGLEVYTASGRRLGRVEEIQEFPANDVLVVRDGEKEVLIPAVADFVEEVDLAGGRIRVKDVEGLTG